jgi:NAD(P)-dependent dehydrogenase (short-subunit alcohol dehydrogenase family)
MKKFQDHVVWITGGGSGIGKALSIEFARQGAYVAVSGRRKNKLEEVIQEIEKTGSKALAVECDVSDDKSVLQAVSQVVSHFGKLDISIANAGFGVNGSVENLDISEWKRQYGTNVFGLISTIRHSLPHLHKTRGRMVLVGSVMGYLSLPNYGPYQSSKHAVRSIAQTLSMELYGTGVTCTNLQPGFVESEIVQIDNAGKLHEDWDDRRPAWFIWKADKAARTMLKAIYKRKREFTFTGHGIFISFIAKHFPSLIHFFVTRFGMGKKRPREKG